MTMAELTDCRASNHFDEGERQMLLLAIAELALSRPGWDWMLGEVADRFEGRAMFDQFKKLNAGGFVSSIARAALVADHENYPLLRAVARGSAGEVSALRAQRRGEARDQRRGRAMNQAAMKPAEVALQEYLYWRAIDPGENERLCDIAIGGIGAAANIASRLAGANAEGIRYRELTPDELRRELQLLASASEMKSLLKAAHHGFLSYAHGNIATDLAEEMAETIQKLLDKVNR